MVEVMRRTILKGELIIGKHNERDEKGKKYKNMERR